jgi:hypothetical protein
LSTNTLVKNDLDKFFQIRKINADKIVFSQNEKQRLLFTFVNKYNRVPKGDEYFTDNQYGSDIKIGSIYNSLKRQILGADCELYKILSINQIIKTNLDKYLETRDKNKIMNKTICRKSLQERIDIILLFVYKYNRIPQQNEQYDNINIGQIYGDLKKQINGIDSNIYKLLSVRQIIKENLDELLKFRDNKFTQEEKEHMIHTFVKKYNRIPKIYEKINDDFNVVDDGYKLGSIYNVLKGTIADNISDLYKRLSVNPLIKTDLDKTITTRNQNKSGIILPHTERLNLLFLFCDKSQKVPEAKKQVDSNCNVVEKDGIRLGGIYDKYKGSVRNDLITENYDIERCRKISQIYKELGEHPIIKTDLDRYLNYLVDKKCIKSDIEPNKEKRPSPKSTTVKPKIKTIDEPIKETEVQRVQRQQSEYQELTKKMATQKSETTNQMFTTTPSLWHSYHDSRDFSFKGYDNQDDIPLNKIIKYLETKKSHKLNILDLGCGRNLIQEHFKDNKKFTVTGYDYVTYNGSKVADISQLPEEDESVKVCVYSQALMGSNWKEYLVEGYRVLEYNGEMIISESVERYDIVKEQLAAIGMHIIREEYAETQRWFYIYAIKQ